MTELPPLARQRAIIASTTIEILRCYSRAYFGTERIGENTEDILIGCSLIIGQANGQPLSATDVAEYVGLPRATVVRKLKLREEQGLIISTRNGRRVQYTVSNASDKRIVDEMGVMISRVKRGIRELSNLDGWST